MIPRPDHVIAACDLAVPVVDDLYASAPAAEGYLGAVRALNGTFEGHLATIGCELRADGRLQTHAGIGLSPGAARDHAYALLVLADILDGRTERAD